MSWLILQLKQKHFSLLFTELSHDFSLFSSFATPPPSVHLRSLFAVRCGGCAEAISPAELVMHAGAAVFHLRCFTCSVCSCRLQTGDRCVLREGQLLCAREDYHQCLASPTSSDTGTGCSGQCVQPNTSAILGFFFASPLGCSVCFKLYLPFKKITQLQSRLIHSSSF